MPAKSQCHLGIAIGALGLIAEVEPRSRGTLANMTWGAGVGTYLAKGAR